MSFDASSTMGTGVLENKRGCIPSDRGQTYNEPMLILKTDSSVLAGYRTLFSDDPTNELDHSIYAGMDSLQTECGSP